MDIVAGPTVATRPATPLVAPRPGRLAAAVLAAGAIAVSASVHIPLGLPGWRGLLWLPVLVATAVLARERPGTVSAVGAVAAVLATAGGTLPAQALPYAAAAVLLDAAIAVPAVRRHPWLLVPLAAPIHLVALAGPLSHGADALARAPSHLLFGLAAGVIGWAAGRATDGQRGINL